MPDFLSGGDAAISRSTASVVIRRFRCPTRRGVVFVEKLEGLFADVLIGGFFIWWKIAAVTGCAYRKCQGLSGVGVFGVGLNVLFSGGSSGLSHSCPARHRAGSLDHMPRQPATERLQRAMQLRLEPGFGDGFSP